MVKSTNPKGVTIGIPAHNEEGNIKNLLEKVLLEAKYLSFPAEVIVASSSTDDTNRIVSDFIANLRDYETSTRVRLIEGERRGKVAAINTIIANATYELLILEDADSLPLTPVYLHLLGPLLQDERCGVSTGRYLLTNNPNTFLGFCSHSISKLHHLLGMESLKRGFDPKVHGSLYAFRKEIVAEIPEKVVTDDQYVSWCASRKGYRSIYVAEAKFIKSDPENLRDYLRARKRVLAGHCYHKKITGEVVPTVNLSLTFPLLVKLVSGLNKRTLVKELFFLSGMLTLEVLCRISASYDIWRGRIPYIYKAGAVGV